jgi:hypothetical protein
MITALLILVALLVALLNYQFYDAFIGPRIRADKIEMQKVLDNFKEMELAKAQADFKLRNKNELQ